MTDRINIHQPIYDICGRLGLVPTNVAELVFRPRTVTATVYVLNEQGAKYVDPATGQPPTETREFEVTT